VSVSNKQQLLDITRAEDVAAHQKPRFFDHAPVRK